MPPRLTIIARITELAGADVAALILEKNRGWTPVEKIISRLAELSGHNIAAQIAAEYRGLVYLKRQKLNLATARAATHIIPLYLVEIAIGIAADCAACPACRSTLNLYQMRHAISVADGRNLTIRNMFA